MLTIKLIFGVFKYVNVLNKMIYYGFNTDNILDMNPKI